MKSIGLAAMVFVGISFAANSSFAAILVPRGTLGSANVAATQFSDLVATASKTAKQSTKEKKRKRYSDDFNFSYQELRIIPGHVPTPYGYRDCIGRWHLHGNGIIHCHGQL